MLLISTTTPPMEMHLQRRYVPRPLQRSRTFRCEAPQLPRCGTVTAATLLAALLPQSIIFAFRSPELLQVEPPYGLTNYCKQAAGAAVGSLAACATAEP